MTDRFWFSCYLKNPEQEVSIVPRSECPVPEFAGDL